MYERQGALGRLLPGQDAKPLPPPEVRSEPGTWEDQNCYGYGGGGAALRGHPLPEMTDLGLTYC